MNNSFWIKPHDLSSEGMATADMDKSGRDDVIIIIIIIIIDFGVHDTWVRMNNATWVQLHSLSPEAMAAGNVDGN